MSVEGKQRVITTHKLLEMKVKGEKIAMITAYDYTFAGIVDEAGIDIILVGDSAANVMAGHETTLPITIDQMIYHAQSVMRAVKNPLVVCDMPFGTYQGNPKEAVRSAIRIMKESEVDAVKMEGGSEIMESVERILSTGIPVMGFRIAVSKSFSTSFLFSSNINSWLAQETKLPFPCTVTMNPCSSKAS